ncbi:MAG: AsmA-like C-terminal domain-containing protein [Desulfomonilia bacterium]
MRSSSRILLIIAGCVTLGALVLLLVFYTCVLRCPETITRSVENRMEQDLGAEVVIAHMSLDIFTGPRAVLSGIQIGSQEDLFLSAESVEAYLSPWRLIFGKVAIRSAVVKNPSGVIRVENLPLPGAHGDMGGLPALTVEGGSLRILFGQTELDLSRINGSLSRRKADLRMEALGSQIKLSAVYPSPSTITLETTGLDLGMLRSDVAGTADLTAVLNFDGTTMRSKLDARVSSLKVPWHETRLDETSVRIRATGAPDAVTLEEISLKTPLVEFHGTGNVNGLETASGRGDARLTLDLTSTVFDYEQVVNFLPVESFPEWLRILLTTQIRDGTSRFSKVHYDGTITDLLRGETFFRNLSVVQDLMNQSFSAGYSADRITAITGSVLYGPEDIEFHNLTGTMGESSLDRVNILFGDVLSEAMRVGVDVDLDMDAEDFIPAWRAALVPETVYALLNPVGTMTEGRVRAQVSTYSDSASDAPVQLRGIITLDGCSYTWGTHSVTSHSGSITAEEYTSPVQAVFSGIVDGTRIDELALTLEKPFDENVYRFTLKTAEPPEIAGVKLDTPSRATITGSGTGPRIQGTVEISSQGFTMMGTHYISLATPLEAAGKIAIALEPSPEVSISDLGVRLASSRVNVSARVTEHAGTARVTGVLRLEELAAEISATPQKLHGILRGDMSLSWGDTRSLSGDVVFDDVALYYQENPVTMNGSLALKNTTATTNEFVVMLGDMRTTLAGSLLISDIPRFRGTMKIDGLAITSERGLNSSNFFKKIDADASLTLTHLDLYGIPVETASARAELSQGVLTLSQMHLDGVSGTAKGSVRLNLEGESSYDMVISLKNANMRRFLNALSPGQDWITGDMNLDGHLWGETGSINGSLTMTARDGKIRRYALFNSIFTVLNVYRIVQTGDLELTSRNFPYNFMSSTFSISDGLVTFDDFYIDSNSLQISAVGDYSLKDKRIDATLGIQPLESIDKTISIIPLLGWVLTGDDEKLIVVFLKVKGDIDDPSVRLEPLKTFERPLVSTLLRALKLSTDILNKSQQFIPGKKN